MEQSEIEKVKAREILDCRGNPTVEVDVLTKGGVLGRAAVPSGLSTGRHEALELRDRGNRYCGKGVLGAVKNVNEIIAAELKGRDVRKQREIDELMIKLDGTENKSKLGANAIVGVSMAVAKAAANTLGVPLYRYIGDADSSILPVPMLNIINGGKHAGNDLDFQEHIIMPIGVKSFSEGLRIGTEVYHELRNVLEKKYGKYAVNVGDEGGYAPPMKDVKEALELIMKVIQEAGYENEFGLALDVAASHFYDEKEKKYLLMGRKLTREDMIEFYKDLASTYPVLSIEDPLNQDDFEGFAEITKKLDIQIVGDDIFVTNEKRLREGIKMGAANALLLKVNQIGTLSEALDVAQLAFKNGYDVVVSERSGDTEDPMIADLAVGINCGQIKTGAPARSERNAKYNQLLRIEEELGSSAKYPGRDFRRQRRRTLSNRREQG